MDLETENRVALMLIEEARKLREQADREGIRAYLTRPNVRARPNSRFLTATVLGVQQANRAVEIDEMWRAREKERELEDKLKSKTSSKENKNFSDSSSKHKSNSRIKEENNRNNGASCSSLKRNSNSRSCDSDQDFSDGLRDCELEGFLHSRVKRGRGAVGSRVDEPGPYLPSVDHSDSKEERERRVLGPEKPLFLKSNKSREEDRVSRDSDKKRRSKEKREKEKGRERKKRKEKKRSKHHHRK